MPKVSIVIPIHDMENGAFFLWRAINSILDQSFKDYEIIIIKDGKMAENTNSGIRKAKGELVKILFMDDYFAHESALGVVVSIFDSVPSSEWLITGTNTNPKPSWTDDIATGNNKLGSPSALTFRNHFDRNLYFDERMSWLLDVDLYKRMRERFGKPIIWQGTEVILGIGDHQMTNILTDEEKLSEHKIIQEKYEKN